MLKHGIDQLLTYNYIQKFDLQYAYFNIKRPLLQSNIPWQANNTSPPIGDGCQKMLHHTSFALRQPLRKMCLT